MTTDLESAKNQRATGRSILLALAGFYALIAISSLIGAYLSPEGAFAYVKWCIRTAIGAWLFFAMFKGSHKARAFMSILFGAGAIFLFFQMDGDPISGGLAVTFLLYAAGFWLPSVTRYVTSRKPT